jgi:hypothetical protein
MRGWLAVKHMVVFACKAMPGTAASLDISN